MVASFDDHFGVGVLVKILDQQQVMSNLIQNYAEFGVEALQRFKINKVVLNQDDSIIKVCEVELIDDEGEYAKLKDSEVRTQLLTKVKEQGLKIIEMYASLAKSESRILMN